MWMSFPLLLRAHHLSVPSERKEQERKRKEEEEEKRYVCHLLKEGVSLPTREEGLFGSHHKHSDGEK
jgi:hypothetical protein